MCFHVVYCNIGEENSIENMEALCILLALTVTAFNVRFRYIDISTIINTRCAVRHFDKDFYLL